jgi:hypothetical protein
MLVHASMAYAAERNQVLLAIVTGMTTEFFVVNLKIGHGAAGLASPAIPAEYLLTELVVQLGIKPQAWAFRLCPIHDAFPLK